MTSPSGDAFSRKYYLADGIYPPWSIFATPFSSTGEQRYTKRHESCRKDVERLFGVVKQRFKIMRTGNRINYSDKSTLCDIVRSCFIIHNVIVLYSKRRNVYGERILSITYSPALLVGSFNLHCSCAVIASQNCIRCDKEISPEQVDVPELING